VAYQAGRTAKSPHEGEVHDLRVSIRRLTQALAAFESCFSIQEVKKIKRRLRKIMQLAGDVRDYDIAIETLSRFKSAPAAILASFRKQRKEAERDLTAALKHWVERGTYPKWRAALGSRDRAGANHEPIAATAARVIEPMLAEFASRGKRALGPKASIDRIHRLRIETKRVRYTLELFAPVYGASLDGSTERLKSLQSVLGAISDCEAVREMIGRQGGDRRIESALRRQMSGKLGEFRRLWADSFARAPIEIGAGVSRKPEAPGERRALRLAAG